MLIVVDAHSGVPVYRQIVEQVRFLIASGRLRRGDELPSTRSLAQRLGINPMTVSKAYSQLEADGILRHRPGLPLTVRARSAAAAHTERLAQLRAVLEPSARAARQLGVSPTDAVEQFRVVLAALDAACDATPSVDTQIRPPVDTSKRATACSELRR